MARFHNYNIAAKNQEEKHVKSKKPYSCCGICEQCLDEIRRLEREVERLQDELDSIEFTTGDEMCSSCDEKDT